MSGQCVTASQRVPAGPGRTPSVCVPVLYRGRTLDAVPETVSASRDALEVTGVRLCAWPGCRHLVRPWVLLCPAHRKAVR